MSESDGAEWPLTLEVQRVMFEMRGRLGCNDRYVSRGAIRHNNFYLFFFVFVEAIARARKIGVSSQRKQAFFVKMVQNMRRGEEGLRINDRVLGKEL